MKRRLCSLVIARVSFGAALVLALATASPARAQIAPEEDLATIRNFVKISDQLATSGQVAYDQIASIKSAGYEVVVNLAPASVTMNELEGFLVAEQGMTYVQIPVSWTEPSLKDLKQFFSVMKANEDRKVFVHCFANMRASAFTYLYRTLVAGESEDAALADMNAVWDPNELDQWAGLIATAKERALGRDGD